MGLPARIFNMVKGLRKSHVSLYTTVTMGAAAIASQTSQAKSGMVVTRTNVGTYTITLDDVWYELIGAGYGFQMTGFNLATEACGFWITGVNLSTRTITFVTYTITNAPAVADPPSGMKFFITLHLSNTNV